MTGSYWCLLGCLLTTLGYFYGWYLLDLTTVCGGERTVHVGDPPSAPPPAPQSLGCSRWSTFLGIGHIVFQNLNVMLCQAFYVKLDHITPAQCTVPLWMLYQLCTCTQRLVTAVCCKISGAIGRAAGGNLEAAPLSELACVQGLNPDVATGMMLLPLMLSTKPTS